MLAGDRQVRYSFTSSTCHSVPIAATTILPTMPASSSSRSLLLSAVIALASYVPFEWVAKATLAISLVMFILDPFPPNSRLVALLSCTVVLYLNRLYQRHLAESEIDVEVVVGSDRRQVLDPQLLRLPGRMERVADEDESGEAVDRPGVVDVGFELEDPVVFYLCHGGSRMVLGY